MLERGRVAPPWLMAHVPDCINPSKQPLADATVCHSGFNNESIRQHVRDMLEACGGFWTSSFGQGHNVLVANSPNTEKFKMAHTWKIAVRNYKWLCDLYMAKLKKENAFINKVEYTSVNGKIEFDPYSLRVYMSK